MSIYLSIYNLRKNRNDNKKYNKTKVIFLYIILFRREKENECSFYPFYFFNYVTVYNKYVYLMTIKSINLVLEKKTLQINRFVPKSMAFLKLVFFVMLH